MQKLKNIIVRIKGFTLIELLIVIAIISILASSAIISTTEAKKGARDVRRLEDMKQIANAIEIYLDSNGRKFPDSLDALAPNYIAVLPKDPLTKNNYFYCSNGTAGGTNDGTTFHLAAAMEKYNSLYFDADADLEEDGCENLPNNPSFNGYLESCTETQKCEGEYCDNCLDFSNIVSVGEVGGDAGGGGGVGGGDEEPQCDILVLNTDEEEQEKGIAWTAREVAGGNDAWRSIAHGNNLFVAVSYSGDRVMTSPDGINWTARSAAGNNDQWYSVAYANGMFLSLGTSGDRLMTSGKPTYVYKTCP